MIKEHESDVAYIVFEIMAKKEFFKFFFFHIVFSTDNSVTRYPILMGFAVHQNVAICELSGSRVKNSKSNIFGMRLTFP